MQHLKFSFLVLIFAFSSALKAEILFEGYYKVTQFKKHVGFLVLRHELEAKTGNFKTISFIKLGKGGFDLTETYQAVSTSDLAPLSISYLAAGEKKTKTIEVKFKAGTMTGLVVEDGKKTKINTPVQKGAFLSSALYYLMLRSKDGLKSGAKFDYVAITEEGPVAMNGTVSIDKKMVTQENLQLLKVNNRFAGSDYDNLVTTKGEVVSAITPATTIESVLVKSPEEAMAGLKLPAGTLEKIFGNVPLGATNVYFNKGK